MEHPESISSQPASFCFCTLALGKEYRELALLLAGDIANYAPNLPFVVLTDHPYDFHTYPHILAFKHHQKTIGCYQDKVYVIEKALTLFNSCMFMDADMRILSPFPVYQWQPGITARSCASITKHFATQIKNSSIGNKEYKVVKSAAQELDLNLKNEEIKFVHEFLFVVARESGKELRFLQLWKKIGQYFESKGMYSGEGHTIGLAAAKVGLPIRHDVMAEFDFFKDKVERVRIQQGQADPDKTLSYFEIRQEICSPNRSVLHRAIKKLNKQISFLYRSIDLKIKTLGGISFSANKP
jgi:hypothetical protein